MKGAHFYNIMFYHDKKKFYPVDTFLLRNKFGII